MRIHPRNHVPRKLWYGSQYLGGHLCGISWGRKWYDDRRKELHRCIWWFDHQNIWRYISPIVICKRESYIHGHKALARDEPMNSCEKLKNCVASLVGLSAGPILHLLCGIIKNILYVYMIYIFTHYHCHCWFLVFLPKLPHCRVSSTYPFLLRYTCSGAGEDCTNWRKGCNNSPWVADSGGSSEKGWFQKAGTLGSSRLGYSRWTQISEVDSAWANCCSKT